MRSRFAAFALGLGDYLADTLATTHPDRAVPRAPLVLALSRARLSQRFTGLRILFAGTGGPSGDEPGSSTDRGRTTPVREGARWGSLGQ